MTVNNVAPTVTLSGSNDLTVDEGSTHTYSYTISDSGQDTVSSVTTSARARLEGDHRHVQQLERLVPVQVRRRPEQLDGVGVRD